MKLTTLSSLPNAEKLDKGDILIINDVEGDSIKTSKITIGELFKSKLVRELLVEYVKPGNNITITNQSNPLDGDGSWVVAKEPENLNAIGAYDANHKYDIGDVVYTRSEDSTLSFWKLAKVVRTISSTGGSSEPIEPPTPEYVPPDLSELKNMIGYKDPECSFNELAELVVALINKLG